MSFSVLLSVYEKENSQYFEEALCSIWDQQTRKPGQIVLVKDGPLTTALDVSINKWEKKLNEYLTLVELPENVGFGSALNEGLKHCCYELVVRMDTDDVSLPVRFEKQVAFMEANPDIAASSAVIEEWDDNFSKCIGKRILPLEPKKIEKFAKFRSPLSHATAIFRKSAVLSVGGYPNIRRSQDYPLWSLLLVKGYKLANLPDVLLKKRAGNNFMKKRNVEQFKWDVKCFKYQREIGFINNCEYLRNVASRIFIRVFPNFIKSFLYRNLRK
jgi:glycosyltransferase involved in cell wall biosynthesis